jgi:hypothetical protein
MTDSISTSEVQLCCEVSLAVGEPLYATAARVDVWLLLEYDAAWGGKALPESDLPETVKTFITHQQDSIAKARFQFIKRAAPGAKLAFYVALARQADPRLYRFELDRYEDLPALDLAGIAAALPAYDAARVHEPLYLVCTNGKRDAACARYGLPLYQHMSAHAGESAWQTIHIGGHRFAGTLVCLPHGLTYGRVAPADAPKIVDDYRAGRITLTHYRGASYDDAPVQAADYFLRKHTNMRALDAFRLRALKPVGEAEWQVEFKDKHAITALVHVRAAPSTFATLESSKDAARKQVTQYHLVNIR